MSSCQDKFWKICICLYHIISYTSTTTIFIFRRWCILHNTCSSWNISVRVIAMLAKFLTVHIIESPVCVCSLCRFLTVNRFYILTGLTTRSLLQCAGWAFTRIMSLLTVYCIWIYILHSAHRWISKVVWAPGLNYCTSSRWSSLSRVLADQSNFLKFL